VRRINIRDPGFGYDETDPEGFRAGMLRLGKELRARLTGVTLYELPPGQAVCPYHYEWAEEEWLLVLDGRPTLRHPEGTDELEPLDALCFPTGPEGAHAIRNETDDTVRLLMFSNVVHPNATVYPDSDKIGIWTGSDADDLVVRRSSRVNYWDGEGSGGSGGG
jgi:uncharacterized cupin superfamily protein